MTTDILERTTMSAKEAMELTDIARRAAVEVMLSSATEEISEQAADGATWMSFELGEQFMDGPVPHDSVWEVYARALLEKGYCVYYKNPAYIIIAWCPLDRTPLDLMRLVVEDRYSAVLLRDGEITFTSLLWIPDAQDVLEEWLDQPLRTHMKALSAILRRRPWGSYYILPTVHFEAIKASLESAGWVVRFKRLSQDTTRTHITVKPGVQDDDH